MKPFFVVKKRVLDRYPLAVSENYDGFFCVWDKSHSNLLLSGRILLGLGGSEEEAWNDADHTILKIEGKPVYT